MSNTPLALGKAHNNTNNWGHSYNFINRASSPQAGNVRFYSSKTNQSCHKGDVGDAHNPEDNISFDSEIGEEKVIIDNNVNSFKTNKKLAAVKLDTTKRLTQGTMCRSN